MRVGVPRERTPGERRVALVPDAVRKLRARGLEVAVEPGAGEAAAHSDDAFRRAGADLDAAAAWTADAVAKVRGPLPEELERLRPGAVLVGFLEPLADPSTARGLARAGVTAFAMEAVPRITRAQAMDALSSQASVTGYRAALIAAQELGRFFPMLMTAAGTVAPAKVLVLGAGVAGLQALATARRLGAVVTGYDVRAAVREQVESLGARFLALEAGGEDAEGEGGYARALAADVQDRQREGLARVVGDFDVIITTALIPGRRAPVLLTAEAVAGMRPGAVVVDLAGELGGNCELSQPGRTIVSAGGVHIAAPLNLPSTMPEHASQLYARNVSALLELLTADGELRLDFDDPIVAGACIAHAGELRGVAAEARVEAA